MQHSVCLITKDTSYHLGFFQKDIAENIIKQVIQLNEGNHYISGILIIENNHPITNK